MWSQLTGVAAAKAPTAATLGDDEQIIVVVDSVTGEVRQCGNLSGHCTAFNPWSANMNTPANVGRHRGQIEAERAATSK